MDERADYLYRGSMSVQVQGVTLDATVEQLEMDRLPSHEVFYPALDRSVEGYPTFQVYVDGQERFSGYGDELGHSHTNPYSAAGLRAHLESFLSALAY